MTALGIYDRENHKFVRHYDLCYEGEKDIGVREGWRLFKYNSELEAAIDYQERFRGHSIYEIKELPANEPEWVF